MSNDLAAVFRREVGRCTATLIRILGDVDAAEDAVADAFAIATEKWAVSGIPPNPGGWLTTTARNRAIDRIRRESTRIDHYIEAYRLNAPIDDHKEIPEIDQLVDIVADDQLRLIFLCCHPALSVPARVALTLRLLGGLSTPEIARAFLVPETAMAQRIVRAKRKLRDNHAPYRIPTAEQLPERLHSVLAVVYLIFNEGHTASSTDELVRVDLSNEAIRLGRVLHDLMPDEPEVSGLLALMLLTDARRPARVGADGLLVRLSEQDRTLWDRRLIEEGHELVRACLRRNQPGIFQIQAAIAAVHADAAEADATDWDQIVRLYDQLYLYQPNAVTLLNRAIALGELEGAAAGLGAITEIDERILAEYPPFHAAKADLLVRVGKPKDAAVAYQRAIALSANQVERRFLQSRLASLRSMS